MAPLDACRTCKAAFVDLFVRRALASGCAAGVDADGEVWKRGALRACAHVEEVNTSGKYVHVDGNKLCKSTASTSPVSIKGWTTQERAFAVRHAHRWGMYLSNNGMLRHTTPLCVHDVATLTSCLERAAESGQLISDIVTEYEGAHVDVAKLIADGVVFTDDTRVWCRARGARHRNKRRRCSD